MNRNPLIIIGVATVTVTFLIAAFALEFRIKYVVKERGHPWSLRYGVLRDLRFFRGIIASESNRKKKRQYQGVLHGFFVAALLGFLGVLSMWILSLEV